MNNLLNKKRSGPLKPGTVDKRTVKEVVIGSPTATRLEGQEMVPRNETAFANPTQSRNAAWLEEANEIMDSIDAYESAKTGAITPQGPHRRGRPGSPASKHPNPMYDESSGEGSSDSRYHSWTAGATGGWSENGTAGTPRSRARQARSAAGGSDGNYNESESSVDYDDVGSRRSGTSHGQNGDHIPTILEEPVPGDDGALHNALQQRRAPRPSPLGMGSDPPTPRTFANPKTPGPRAAPSLNRNQDPKPQVEQWVRNLLGQLSHRRYRQAMMMPAPRAGRLHCYLRRRKDSMKGDQYSLHLEGSNLFLMAARQRKKSINTQYLLAAEGGKVTRKGSANLAVLKANYSGTQYTAHSTQTVNAEGRHVTAAELCAVRYKQTTLTVSGGPRQLTCVLPDPDLDCQWGPADDHETLHSVYEKTKRKEISQQVSDKISVLKSNPPVWDDALKSYVLDFGGRVHDSSVKNCQLTTYDMDSKDRGGHLVFMFGRASEDDADRFVCDFCYPLCALQAMCIALSVLDNKLCYAM